MPNFSPDSPAPFGGGMTAPAAATAQEPLIERLEKLCVTITRPIAFIGVTGMLIAAGVTVLDVLMRWLAGTAITALNEITALIFAVAVAACMPAGLAGGVNLRIDLLARSAHARAEWQEVYRLFTTTDVTKVTLSRGELPGEQVASLNDLFRFAACSTSPRVRGEVDLRARSLRSEANRVRCVSTA